MTNHSIETRVALLERQSATTTTTSISNDKTLEKVKGGVTPWKNRIQRFVQLLHTAFQLLKLLVSAHLRCRNSGSLLLKERNLRIDCAVGLMVNWNRL
jgi:hypothetical protein